MSLVDSQTAGAPETGRRSGILYLIEGTGEETREVGTQL